MVSHSRPGIVAGIVPSVIIVELRLILMQVMMVVMMCEGDDD